MKKAGAFFCYVAALAAFAGMAWQFPTPPPTPPPPPDPSFFTQEEARLYTKVGQDIPEHLYPEGFPFLERFPSRDPQLAKALDSSIPVLQLVAPAFIPPYVVGLKEEDGEFAVFLMEKVQVADLQSAIHDRAPTCKRSIDVALGRRIVAAWAKVVAEARPTLSIPYGGNDGEDEHFAVQTRWGPFSGWLWQPRKPFAPGWLSQAASDLARICQQNDAAAQSELETALQAIEAAK